MSEINEMILEQLKAYPPKVSKLAIEAVKLSENSPEQSVAEQLKSLVREIARED